LRFVTRPARPEELPELAEAFAAAYVENLIAIPMPRHEAEALADMALRQVMLKAGDYPELLVPVTEDVETGRIAAALAVMLVPAAGSAHGLYMWVREEYRGRGLFTRRMFNEVEQVLAGRGITRVEFGVMLTNPRAEGIYRALGYRPYATLFVKRLD
jgi:GNAT superfamily N-acetyltransferase